MLPRSACLVRDSASIHEGPATPKAREDRCRLGAAASWSEKAVTLPAEYDVPFYPGGWLRASTRDLARFLAAFMQHGRIDGNTVLDSATVDLMSTVQSPDPVWGGYGWGLGWTSKTWGGRLIWGHMGNAEGASTEMWYSPEEGVGVIVLSNGESTWGPRLILHEIFEHVVGETVVDPPPAAAARPEGALRLEGHPNPFNPTTTTTIAFDLPAPSTVSLRVYDLLGREVAVLVDGPQAAGEHRAVFDGSGLASGPYIARLTAAGASRSRKLMLLK